jgi:hypothetical protein
MAAYVFAYQEYTAEKDAPSLRAAFEWFLSGPNSGNDVAVGFDVEGPEGSFYFQNDDGDIDAAWAAGVA